MAINYQLINEALAKGKPYQEEIRRGINAADLFLKKGRGKSPEWLEFFLNSNREKMVETICRATRESAGMASLEGYSEGYFTEIIQNANDLHWGDYINIRVANEGPTYTFTCQYEDEGFDISNIYAFLNREMSDKSKAAGQTGKFGIGIKSFFQFVNTLTITSNVRMHFEIQRSSGHTESVIKGTVALNPEWDQKTTQLTFSFDGRYDNGFNIEKLINLTHYLNGIKAADPVNFFYEGKENEIVFDVRSFLFMNLDGKRTSISRISFTGTRCHIELTCQYKDRTSVKFNETDWNVIIASLTVSGDYYHRTEDEYIIFSNGTVAFAYPTEDKLENPNRYYSTYYLKTSDETSPFLPASTLIHTCHANIHRTDIGDSMESIRKAYDSIRAQMLNLYEMICSKNAGDCSLAVQISNIFHLLLLSFYQAGEKDYDESPLNSDALTTEYLPKTIEGNKCRYVVRHKREEAYQKSTYAEGDIAKDLTSVYLKVIECDEVIYYEELVDDDDCIAGVCDLYSAITAADATNNKNYRRMLDILNLFPAVKNLIAFRISGEKPLAEAVTDADIDAWIEKCTNHLIPTTQINILLKLVGRYNLNKAVSYNGDILEQELNFRDYLFSDTTGSTPGVFAQLQQKAYDKKYSAIKAELLGRRYTSFSGGKESHTIDFIYPVGRSWGNWDRYYDCSGVRLSSEAMNPFSHPMPLLERIVNDDDLSSSLGQNSSDVILFQKKPVIWYSRTYPFKHSHVLSQTLISLNGLKKIKLNTMEHFFAAVWLLNRIPDSNLREAICVSCSVDEVDTQYIAEHMLPIILAETPEVGKLTSLYAPQDFYIKSIKENTNNNFCLENQDFVERLITYRVHLYHFESQSKSMTLCFAFGSQFYIKSGSAKTFTQVAKVGNTGKEIYIFYDNYDDINRPVSQVLQYLDIGEKALELFDCYIYNGHSTKTLGYEAYTRSVAKVKRKLVLDWCDLDMGIRDVYDNEVLYRLLTARGSYDIFCPICADIPLETIDFTDKDKKKHSRRLLILRNENPNTKDSAPYIVTVCCNYCFERLKNTLTGSEFDGKYLTLKTQVAHGQHEKLAHKQQIELSPVNIEIIKRFRKRVERKS